MKIVLAYSGGLDTSTALRWLQINYNAEVIAYCANIGQTDDLDEIKRNAEACGASEIIIEDLREEYLRSYVFPALKANARYEGQYLMAAPLGRPLIAKRLVEIARQYGADAVAHGSTGKGNDQVRFYSGAISQDPEIQVIAPCMIWELNSREDEVAYAKEHNIPLPHTHKGLFSKDGSLWGSSTECGPIDDTNWELTEEVYQMTSNPRTAPTEGQRVNVRFEKGNPIGIDGANCDPITLVQQLNEVGRLHGIGRLDMIENSLLGIKTRAVYESPGGTLLHLAHRALESMCIDRDTLHYKEHVSIKYAELVYYGQWFTPLRLALDAFIEQTQQNVSGEIEIEVRQGRASVIKRHAEKPLYYTKLSSHGESNSYQHELAEGFSYVWSMPQRIEGLINQEYLREQKPSPESDLPSDAAARST